MLSHRVRDEADQVAVAELDVRQVHGDRKPRVRAPPLADLPARGAQHPLADREDQPRLLQHGDEARRGHGSELPALPADERLGARDLAAGEVAVRLIVDAVLAVAEAVRDAALDRVDVKRPLAQLAGEETDRVAAEGLGERERSVGVLQQGSRVGEVLGCQRDPDAHRDGDVVAGDVRLSCERAENALGERARLGGAAAEEDAELVAAQAADGAVQPDELAQHAGDVPQHFVPDFRREVVVDVPEALDVHHEHRELFAAPLRQLVLEQSQEVAPVGNSGQRIEAVELEEALLDLFLARHVPRRGDESGRALLAFLHRSDVFLEQERRAVLPLAAHRPSIGASGEQGVAHLVEGPILGVPGEPAPAARGQQLFAAESRGRLDRPVDVLDPALAVHDRDEHVPLVDALREASHPDLAAAPAGMLALQESQGDEHDEARGAERDRGQVLDDETLERRVSRDLPGRLVGGEGGHRDEDGGQSENADPFPSPTPPHLVAPRCLFERARQSSMRNEWLIDCSLIHRKCEPRSHEWM